MARAVTNFLYRIFESGYFFFEVFDFAKKRFGDIGTKLVNIEFRELHIFLFIVGFETFNLLAMTAAVEEPSSP